MPIWPRPGSQTPLSKPTQLIPTANCLCDAHTSPHFPTLSKGMLQLRPPVVAHSHCHGYCHRPYEAVELPWCLDTRDWLHLLPCTACHHTTPPHPPTRLPCPFCPSTTSPPTRFPSPPYSPSYSPPNPHSTYSLSSQRFLSFPAYSIFPPPFMASKRAPTRPPRPRLLHGSSACEAKQALARNWGFDSTT